jgi:hypothetical protein
MILLDTDHLSVLKYEEHPRVRPWQGVGEGGCGLLLLAEGSVGQGEEGVRQRAGFAVQPDGGTAPVCIRRCGRGPRR